MRSRISTPAWRSAAVLPARGRAAAAVLVAGLVLAGCVATPSGPSPAAPSGSASAPGRDPGAAEGALALPRCETVGLIAAPAGWYRPKPVYVSNEMSVDAVRAWAQGRPGFQDLWIDRDHQGWLTVGFSADPEARQAELVEAFPGVGVVAVEVPFTVAEMAALQARVMAAGRDIGLTSSSSFVGRGVVEAGIGVLDPARVAALAERFPGEPICVDGLDPADAPKPGAQAPAGDGWRLLGHKAGAGPGYRTGIATTPAQLEALWGEAGLSGAPPAVEFVSEVAIWFSAVTGSSCPDLRFDRVAVDRGRALVWADIARLDVGACTADIYPHAFVVAVRRDQLPAAPFGIQLGPDDPPGGAPEERTVVDAPVQLPGVVARPDDIHRDPALLLPVPVVVEPGGYLEPGFEPPFRFPVACGVEWIGPLNGTWWRTEDPAAAGGALPPEWTAVLDAEGWLVAAISMRTEPAELDVTAGERSISYTAVSGEPACR